MKGRWQTICRFIVCFTIFLESGLCSVYSQNIVPNYSFEEITYCPTDPGSSGSTIATPWESPTVGTPDIYNACNVTGTVDVPVNIFGEQEARTGVGYAGFFAYDIDLEFREYLTASLGTALTAGQWYYVTFYINLPELACGVPRVGAYFSADFPYTMTLGALDVIPQVESNSGFLSDYDNWMEISGCFQAVGDEAFITVGNFHDDINTIMEPGCNGDFSYYYLEDVTVIAGPPPEDFQLELGGHVFACYSYEIEAGVEDVDYYWSTGSQSSTITVSTSGTYVLTISNACVNLVDSVEVTIGGNNPVIELEVDEIILCEGESYQINLDPSFNEYVWSDGSTGPNFEITSPGSYSVTLDDGCASSSDEITAHYDVPLEAISLGDDQYLCYGQTLQYSFDPQLGSYLWQDGSTAPQYAIYESGIYAISLTNACGSVTDEILISELEPPEINLGPALQVLCENNSISFDFSNVIGDFTWQNGSHSSQYEIISGGEYYVNVENICGEDGDTIEVAQLNVPEFNLGPDQMICNGDTILLYAGYIEGTYIWQDGSSEVSYSVTSEGIYSLNVENECGIAVDTILVSFIDVIQHPNLGEDLTLCPGDSITLQISSTNASLLWQNGSTADSFIVYDTGLYTVKAFNECYSFMDSIQIFASDDPPQIDFHNDFFLCQGQQVVIDPHVSNVSFFWSDHSTGNTLSVNSPGIYSLTVSNACGSDVDSVIVMDGGPAPFVELGNNISFCASDTFVLSPDFSDINHWNWNNGYVTSTIAITNAGVYSVIASNNCGVAYDTIVAVLLPDIPSIELGNDTAICNGETLILSIGIQNVNIIWSNGSTDSFLPVETAGTYFATINNECGSVADTIQVTELTEIPTLNLGIDQSLCPGELILIEPGIDEVEYNWQDGSSGTYYEVTSADTIILSINNSCGTSSDTLYITESTEGPTIDLGYDITGCAGEIIAINPGLGGVDYLWQDGSTSTAFHTNVSTEVVLTISNNCGADSDTLLIDLSFQPPYVELGGDTILCSGEELWLASTTATGNSLLWQDGSTNQSFEVTSPGIYYLHETNDCGFDADTIDVNFIDKPEPFTLGYDTTLCPGNLIFLNTPPTLNELIWNNGSDADSIEVNQPGIYSLTISNECGSAYDEIEIFYEDFSVIESPVYYNLCVGRETLELNAQQSFHALYNWSTGSTFPSITVEETGEYIVTVTTSCHTTGIVFKVSPDEACLKNKNYYLPNIFSPNGDGLNDIFNITFSNNSEIESGSIVIYDRWGDQVYSSNAITFVWDGTKNGKEVNPGVYAYRMKLNYIDPNVKAEEWITGEVTLIK